MLLLPSLGYDQRKARWAALTPVRAAGINAVVFYAPVLFSSLGMGQDAALLSSVITGAVFVAATIISILTVDTFGRRVGAPFLPLCDVCMPSQLPIYTPKCSLFKLCLRAVCCSPHTSWRDRNNETCCQGGSTPHSHVSLCVEVQVDDWRY